MGDNRVRRDRVCVHIWEIIEGALTDPDVHRCPGVPLPPYFSPLGATSSMSYTPLDEAPRGSAVRACLEAASLLENECCPVPAGTSRRVAKRVSWTLELLDS
jgi:hypothetical protein